VNAHHWGVFFAPLVAFLLFGVIALAIKLAIALYLPDGWLKRALLKERIASRYSEANRRLLERTNTSTGKQP